MTVVRAESRTEAFRTAHARLRPGNGVLQPHQMCLAREEDLAWYAQFCGASDS